MTYKDIYDIIRNIKGKYIRGKKLMKVISNKGRNSENTDMFIIVIFLLAFLGAFLAKGVAKGINHCMITEVQQTVGEIVNIDYAPTNNKRVIYTVFTVRYAKDEYVCSYLCSSALSDYANLYQKGDLLPIEVTKYKNGVTTVLVDTELME